MVKICICNISMAGLVYKIIIQACGKKFVHCGRKNYFIIHADASCFSIQINTMYVRRTYIHCRLYINYLQFSCLTNFSVWLFFCFAIFSSSLTTCRHLLGQWMNMKYKYCDKIKHKQQISHLCSDWINYTHISKFCSTCYGGGGDSFFFIN